MNQEDILKMAREAGITFKPMVVDGVEYEYRFAECNDDIGGDEAGCIERFAALVAAKAAQDEREACALVCESHPWIDGQTLPSNHEMARAIRARSQ